MIKSARGAGAPRVSWEWLHLLPPVLIACVPIAFRQPYFLTTTTQVAIFAIAAMNLDLLMGYCGMASFGQAAFFGLGGYTAGLVGTNYSSFIAVTLGAAMVAAGVAAIMGGWLAIRATGIYFIFLTLALSQMVFAVVYSWSSLTGGDDGLSGIPRPSLGRIDFLINLSDDRTFYLLVLIVAVLVYGLLRRITVSCFGSVLEGIRDNPERMQAVGYNVKAHKIAAFCLSGTLTGLAGALFAYQFQLVTPEQTDWRTSALLMMMVILGGSGSLVGPILGAFILILLQNVVSSFTDRWASIMAVMFIVVVRYARGGLWGLIGNNSWVRRR